MGLGRRKVARQLPPTSREVLPVRPLRGPWSYWGTGVAWGSQTALQMSGVRWGLSFSSFSSPSPPPSISGNHKSDLFFNDFATEQQQLDV